MLTIWPVAAGSALVLALAAGPRGEPAMSMEMAMAWSMISILDLVRKESLSGLLADGEVLASKGSPLGSGANWKSLVASLDGRKFALTWLDEFDDAAADFLDFPKALESSIQHGSESGGLWFSGAYRKVDGEQPRAGTVEIPALPADVANGTPVAGIVLQR